MKGIVVTGRQRISPCAYQHCGEGIIVGVGSHHRQPDLRTPQQGSARGREELLYLGRLVGGGDGECSRREPLAVPALVHDLGCGLHHRPRPLPSDGQGVGCLINHPDQLQPVVEGDAFDGRIRPYRQSDRLIGVDCSRLSDQAKGSGGFSVAVTDLDPHRRARGVDRYLSGGDLPVAFDVEVVAAVEGIQQHRAPGGYVQDGVGAPALPDQVKPGLPAGFEAPVEVVDGGVVAPLPAVPGSPDREVIDQRLGEQGVEYPFHFRVGVGHHVELGDRHRQSQYRHLRQSALELRVGGHGTEKMPLHAHPVDGCPQRLHLGHVVYKLPVKVIAALVEVVLVHDQVHLGAGGPGPFVPLGVFGDAVVDVGEAHQVGGQVGLVHQFIDQVDLVGLLLLYGHHVALQVAAHDVPDDLVLRLGSRSRGVKHGVGHGVPAPDARPDGGVQAVADIVGVEPVHHLQVLRPVVEVKPLLPLTRITRRDGVKLPQVVVIGVVSAYGDALPFERKDLVEVDNAPPAKGRLPHPYV